MKPGTPEQRIAFLTPKLLKAIKKALPQIRSKYVAKELMHAVVPIMKELKSIKGLEVN